MNPIPIAPCFDLKGDAVTGIAPLAGGHIHETFVVSCGKTRRVLQRINRRVFPDVEGLMENIERVTGHLKGERVPRPILSASGETFHRDAEGDCWRMFPFIGNTVTAGAAPSPDQAREAARAFGEFYRRLADLPGPRLRETIPGFHDTPQRFADFSAAVEEDVCGRVKSAGEEISRARDCRSWVRLLTNGELPERIAHNDAKTDNVLLDADTGAAVCVIDLDTVMPGSPLYDFGDLVRSAAATASEDEAEEAKIWISLPVFVALAEGFLSGCGGILTPAEKALLLVAGKVITYEQSLRFLTDYLRGDIYYRTLYPEHNLVRARNQLRLAEVLDASEVQLAAICQC